MPKVSTGPTTMLIVIKKGFEGSTPDTVPQIGFPAYALSRLSPLLLQKYAEKSV